MDARPEISSHRAVLFAAGCAALLTVACGGSSEVTPTERLWVSSVPKSPRQPFTAFLATRTSDGKFIGAFFRGSLFRGGHDVFEWKSHGKDTANLRFLQDGNQAALRFESCKPTRGFDHCIVVHGDPTGTRRYQSRKRWKVRRPGKKATLDGIVTATIADLAGDDEQLQALIELE